MAHEPLNLGGRFSANARTASLWSSRLAERALRPRLEVGGVLEARARGVLEHTPRLRTASGGCSAIATRELDRARATSPPPRPSSSQRPIRSASSPVTGSPVRTMRFAWPIPTRRTQQPARAAVGDEADPDEAEVEARVRRGDHDVARERPRARHARDRAVHCGDRRLGKVEHAARSLDPVLTALAADQRRCVRGDRPRRDASDQRPRRTRRRRRTAPARGPSRRPRPAPSATPASSVISGSIAFRASGRFQSRTATPSSSTR